LRFFRSYHSLSIAEENMNRIVGMKSPRVAALMLIFPMVAALAGIIVSLKSAVVFDLCLEITQPVAFTFCETVTSGLAQYSRCFMRHPSFCYVHHPKVLDTLLSPQRPAPILFKVNAPVPTRATRTWPFWL
jgi:hypothetical protein